MSISVVVPVWNGRDLLARLLDTVDAQTLRAGEVIVVDNGSSDGAPELARKRGARVIAMGRNAGFAAAVNRAIAEARSEWIAVLNSDVELSPEYFEKLTGAGGWFATGKILDARRNGLIDGAFDLTCRGGTTWRAGSAREDGPVFAERRPIFSPPWTAVMFRADIFREVGLLEASFESYLEDVDFGLRCAASGISGLYVPDAVAWHRGSASLGRWHPDTVRRISRNQMLVVARHFPAKWWWHVLVAQGLWALVALRHGAGLAWLLGVCEGAWKFPGARISPIVPEVLNRIRTSEHLLQTLQCATGSDSYWRLYFFFTRGVAK